MSLLRDRNGQLSSIRVSLLLCVLMDIWLVALMGYDMLTRTGAGLAIDWQGMAAYLGAIAAFTGGGFGFKVLQKKYEHEKS